MAWLLVLKTSQRNGYEDYYYEVDILLSPFSASSKAGELERKVKKQQMLSFKNKLPMVLTTIYGLNSFSYFSAKQWNALPDFFRTSFFAEFKAKIQDVTFM